MEISIVILSFVILGLNPEMPVFIRLIMICNLNGFRQIKYIHTILLICYASDNHIAYDFFCEIVNLIALRVSALHLVLACVCLSLDRGVDRADGLFVSLAHVIQGYSSYHCFLRSDGG